MKKLLAIMMLGVLLTMSLTGCSAGKKEDTSQNTSTSKSSPTTTKAEDTTAKNTEATYTVDNVTGKHHVKIKIKEYGTIAAELDGDVAPITVANFLNLAASGFYDGLTFHRIITDFMIQGGDPLGNGTGGSEKTIKGEFSANGVNNTLSHTRGALSMARSEDFDSGSSQFFIVHKDSLFLDGQYCVFGYVTKGMDIVDKICADTKVEDTNGTVLAENQPIITSIKVID